MKPILFDMFSDLAKHSKCTALVGDAAREAVCFKFDADAMNAVQQARKERYDIKTVIAAAKPPFRSVFLEYEGRTRFTKPAEAGPFDHMPLRSGFCVQELSDGFFINAVDLYPDKVMVFQPYYAAVYFDRAAYPREEVNHDHVKPLGSEYETLLWGEDRAHVHTHIRSFAVPGIGFKNRVPFLISPFGDIKAFKGDFAGDVAIATFMMALVNTNAATVQEVTRRGRYVSGGKTRPLADYRAVTINLDKRYVERPGLGVVRAIASYHKRRHGVRGHWRRLSEDRKVWVKQHERGNESLGRVEHFYKITA